MVETSAEIKDRYTNALPTVPAHKCSPMYVIFSKFSGAMLLLAAYRRYTY